MRFIYALVVEAAATFVLAAPRRTFRSDVDADDVPCLDVPACPDLGTVSYANNVPSTENKTFPKTEVALCYDDRFIQITFTALEETSFYCTGVMSTLLTPPRWRR